MSNTKDKETPKECAGFAPAHGSADRPQCGSCRREMTPQNSSKCPELFLCDDCATLAAIPAQMLQTDWLRLHRENQALREALDKTLSCSNGHYNPMFKCDCYQIAHDLICPPNVEVSDGAGEKL